MGSNSIEVGGVVEVEEEAGDKGEVSMKEIIKRAVSRQRPLQAVVSQRSKILN